MSVLSRLVPPGTEPVSLAQVKDHLRIEHSDEDGVLQDHMSAARAAIESYTRRVIIEQSWQLVLDRWPLQPVRIPKPPLIAVDAVRVFDASHNAQLIDVADYRTETRAIPGFLLPAPGKAWPRPGVARSGIEIDFRAGYGPLGDNVPAPINQAILLIVSALYEQRCEAKDLISGPVADLVQPYRVPRL